MFINKVQVKQKAAQQNNYRAAGLPYQIYKPKWLSETKKLHNRISIVQPDDHIRYAIPELDSWALRPDFSIGLPNINLDL